MTRRPLALLALLLALVGCFIAACGGGSQSIVPSPKPAASCPKQLTAKTPKNVRRHCERWATHAVPAPPGAKLKAEQTVEMQDTIDVSTIVGHPFACAGYTSGYWPSYGPLVNSGRCGRVVSIAINGYHVAQCGDFEPGDMDPSQAAAWWRYDRANGVAKPCLYSSTSEMYSIQGNLSANGIGRGAWRKWCAHYTYYAHLEGDCDGVQWTDHAYGLNLDQSTMKLSFFQGAKPPPPPGPTQKQIKAWRQAMQNARHTWVVKGCGNHPIQNPCPHYRRLVSAYEQLLEQKAHNKHVRCWGAGFGRGNAICAVIRPTYAAWERIYEQAHAKYWGHHCNKHPKTRLCRDASQVSQWASGHGARAWRLSQNSTFWRTI